MIHQDGRCIQVMNQRCLDDQDLQGGITIAEIPLETMIILHQGETKIMVMDHMIIEDTTMIVGGLIEMLITRMLKLKYLEIIRKEIMRGHEIHGENLDFMKVMENGDAVPPEKRDAIEYGRRKMLSR